LELADETNGKISAERERAITKGTRRMTRKQLRKLRQTHDGRHPMHWAGFFCVG